MVQSNTHTSSALALLNCVDASGHSELWVTDGTVAGTHELIIPGASTIGLNPIPIAALGNKALFNGDRNLWITDGTVAGTHELNNIVGASTAPALNPLDITAISKHKALFGGTDTHHLYELWGTDGTVAGTHELVIPRRISSERSRASLAFAPISAIRVSIALLRVCVTDISCRGKSYPVETNSYRRRR
jgi:hypothetical protein